jgi:hypothetical protein
VGFCWGGGLVGRLATADPLLDAAVVFYGRVPPLADVPKIKAPLLLHYAGLDDRIKIFTSLPFDKLDRLSLQKRLDRIGKLRLAEGELPKVGSGT